MLQLLQKTERVPFDTFYSDNFQKAVRYIYGKISNMADAEDLAGEVFLYCYSHYDDYDPAKSSLTTWLYLIINSRIKNHYRDAKSYVDLETVVGVLPDEDVDMEKGVYLEQVRTQLNAAIQKLPERQRQIVIMSYFQKKSSNEIAEALGMTSSNVRVQLSRALDKLENLCSDLL